MVSDPLNGWVKFSIPVMILSPDPHFVRISALRATMGPCPTFQGSFAAIISKGYVRLRLRSSLCLSGKVIRACNGIGILGSVEPLPWWGPAVR